MFSKDALSRKWWVGDGAKCKQEEGGKHSQMGAQRKKFYAAAYAQQTSRQQITGRKDPLKQGLSNPHYIPKKGQKGVRSQKTTTKPGRLQKDKTKETKLNVGGRYN